jgi:hypothetical protein
MPFSVPNVQLNGVQGLPGSIRLAGAAIGPLESCKLPGFDPQRVMQFARFVCICKKVATEGGQG